MIPYILIVEDDVFTGEELASALQKEYGFLVAGVATSGEEALTFFSDPDNLPNFMITDINLSENKKKFSGQTLVQFIRNHFKVQIPIIYISGHNELIHKAVAAQPEHFLTKPVDLDRLKLMIEIEMHKAYGNAVTETQRRYFVVNRGKHPDGTDNKGTIFIDGEIIYCEKEGNRVNIYTDAGINYYATATIKDVYETLHEANRSIIRVHESYLVNLAFIARKTEDKLSVRKVTRQNDLVKRGIQTTRDAIKNEYNAQKLLLSTLDNTLDYIKESEMLKDIPIGDTYRDALALALSGPEFKRLQ